MDEITFNYKLEIGAAMPIHLMSRVLRRGLLNASILTNSTATGFAFIAGAGTLIAIIAWPHSASAADVACVPDLSGTAIANSAETCSGAGDKINYTLPAIVSSTVTLNNVTIPGTAPGTTDAVAINPGITSQTVLATGGSITAVAGNGINVTTATGNGAINVGTAANPINTPISGGNGTNTAQGILVNGQGAINVYTGNVPITGTSTGGGSWSFRIAQTLATALNAPVTLNSQGADVAGRGSILVRNAGTSPTDTVTVITTGIVTGLAGAGIQTSSVNGNTVIIASAPVIGSIGAGNSGISATVTGRGNAAVTTSSAATVTANGAATGVLVSSGSGGMNINLGANVTSAAGNAILTTNSSATGTNTISIGAATIKGLGTGGVAVIDMTSASGGLTTLNTTAGTAISSDSATTAAQNGDLAIKGTGGSIILNNGGSLRGTVNFSAITVATNNVTINNSGNWVTTGVSTFGAGNNVLNNSGVLSVVGSATFTGLQTLNNSGTIATNGVVMAPSTAYVASGAATFNISAALGAGGQSSCPATGTPLANCMVIGAVSGTATTIIVTDTNGTGPGQLNFGGLVLVHAASASAGNFILGGSNVVNTPQGAAIPKGFVQYQLFFDPANVNFTLAGVPAASMMEVGYARAGLQTAWQVSADAWADRIGDLRNEGGGQNEINIWVKGTFGQLNRDNTQSLKVLGSSVLYDATYSQNTHGLEVGADTMLGDASSGAWVFGVLGGYSSSRIRFHSDTDRETPTIWNAGGYAAYFKDNLFADVLIKDDIAKVNLAFPGVTALPHGNSFGAKLTVGAELSDPPLLVDIEPIASVSYIRAQLDDIVDPSATFAFGNGNSVIGMLGAHISTKTPFSDAAIRPFLFIAANQEFSARNPVNIVSGTQTLIWKDRPFTTFGTSSLGIDFLEGHALSGFAAVDGLFADRADGWALHAGMRWMN